jgi:hypothetical protein
MKKFNLLLVQGFIILFMMSCSKDKNLTPLESVNPNIDFNEVILDKNDTVQEKVSKLLLESMEEIINTYEDGAITIDELYTLDHQELQMGTYVSKIYEDRGSDISKLKSVAQRKIIYNNIECSPGILFYNMEKCDKSKSPIFALGVELGENYEDLCSDGKDRIAGIIINNGKKDTLIISEEFADSIENPLIIITNHSGPNFIKQEDIEPVNDEYVKLLSTMSKAATIVDQCERKINTFQIDYRYDKSNKSEYYIAYTSHPEEGFDNASFKLNGLDYQLYDVPKDLIGTIIQYHNDAGCDIIQYEPSLGSYYIVKPTQCNVLIFGMTYEHDWYATRKSQYFTVRGKTFEIRGQMSYSNEYYQIINAHLPNLYPPSVLTDPDYNGIYFGKGFITIRGKLRSCTENCSDCGYFCN